MLSAVALLCACLLAAPVRGAAPLDPDPSAAQTQARIHPVDASSMAETTLLFQEGTSPTASYAGVADTYLFIDRPAENWGFDTYLRLYNDHRQKVLIRFDLAEHIPSTAVVLAAQLEVSAFQRETADYTDVSAYRVLRTWTENAASWNNATASDFWGVPGCEGGGDREAEPLAVTTFFVGNSSYSWESASLRAVVQDWVSSPASNHGVALVGVSPNDRQRWSLFSSQFGTSEEEKLRRPRLSVTFQTVPPTATPTATQVPTVTPTRTQTTRPTQTPTRVEGKAQVSGAAWQDTNRNGARDAGELPMPGIVVILRTQPNNQERSRIVTAADGGYAFPELDPGGYSVSIEDPPGWRCSHPPGGVWAFPLEAGERLGGLDFGFYAMPTATTEPTRTATPLQTVTAVASPTATVQGTATTPTNPTSTSTLTATPSATVLGDSTATATPSVSPDASATATVQVSLTPSATIGPSPTATATPSGTLADPLVLRCQQTYDGDTTGRPAVISAYGSCASGLFGPEVVHALDVAYPLSYLSIELNTSADLALFILTAPSANNCMAYSFGNIGLTSLQPGRYYVVVDGFGQGAYTLRLQCDPPPPSTPTPTPTVIPTATQGPTPTMTVTRPAQGPHSLYMPIMSKPRLQYLVDCGSESDHVDALGRRWSADRQYVAGSWGHVGNPLVWSTHDAIEGTLDDALYQTQRYGNGGSFGYRFDVPNGEYEVRLRFAEIYAQVDAPRKRVFDVHLEGVLVLDNLDVFAQAGGNFRALEKLQTVRVVDGQLNVTFVRDWAQGVDNPIISALDVVRVSD